MSRIKNWAVEQCESLEQSPHYSHAPERQIGAESDGKSLGRRRVTAVITASAVSFTHTILGSCNNGPIDEQRQPPASAEVPSGRCGMAEPERVESGRWLVANKGRIAGRSPVN
jgi:hypothetical protein